MINILIPSMGKSLFFKDSYFPKPMIEVAGKTMLEQLAENFSTIPDRRFIFIFSRKDCTEFHLDESAKILTDYAAEVIVLEEETAGALCTCLMAADLINSESPLIISNADQIISTDFAGILAKFEDESAEAGLITFDSIHPRWSYARIKDGEVIEVAEKRPLSKNAIAGFYWYRHGSTFIRAAQRAVLKGSELNGRYYISSSVNEVILEGGKVAYFPVGRDCYHSFYSPEKITDYEEGLRA
ncbi:MAG: glycosyltransferase family 2 protein [Synergistaceae bacterium]|nr:glycosyltransferase family 2 protein [Synergistaceae bacterium]